MSAFIMERDVILLTKEIHSPEQDLFLVIVDPKYQTAEKVTILLSDRNQELPVHQYSGCVWGLPAQELTTGDNNIEVIADGKVIGRGSVKVYSKFEVMADILNDVTDPLHFIQQALRVQDVDSLEEDLLDIFGANHHHLKKLFGDVSYLKDMKEITSGRELPTILHMFARLGLRRICHQISWVPGFNVAMRTRNKAGLFPSEMARQAGHQELAKELDKWFDEQGDISEAVEELSPPLTKAPPPIQWNDHPSRPTSSNGGRKSFDNESFFRDSGRASTFTVDSTVSSESSGSDTGRRLFKGRKGSAPPMSIALDGMIDELNPVTSTKL